MPLAGFTARAAGGRIVAGLREKTGNDGAVDRFHERTAERYTDLLGHSKGALMKIGQMISMTDAGGLGTGGFAPYQRALNRLQADAPPMAPDLVHDVLDAELGSTARHFIDFTDEPMAAASIGQVHRAVLRDGREVAVKIQYPGVGRAIREDMANTELVATFLRFAMSASGMEFDPRNLARELAVRVAEEVDYRREADSIAAFSELYRDHPFIRVPDIVSEASSDKVLTMTFLDGMSWAEAQQADQDLKNSWAEVITRFSNGNYRHANLLHADPHPGNYRFHPDGTVGFVDFGCVQILPEPKRRLWVTLMRAIVDQRTDDIREDMVTGGFITGDSTLTADVLQRFWEQVFHELVVAPQPATYTADSGSRTARWLFGLDTTNPLSRMTAPEALAFAPRVVTALNSVCGALRATLPAKAITDDLDGVAEPITPLGKTHHLWVRERGLPLGMEHHDQR
jgi:predicted unusual protein kinase regulating ubiquinone biosynthesis (AarF/ABC1/UbiB family)